MCAPFHICFMFVVCIWVQVERKMVWSRGCARVKCIRQRVGAARGWGWIRRTFPPMDIQPSCPCSISSPVCFLRIPTHKCLFSRMTSRHLIMKAVGLNTLLPLESTGRLRTAEFLNTKGRHRPNYKNKDICSSGKKQEDSKFLSPWWVIGMSFNWSSGLNI